MLAPCAGVAVLHHHRAVLFAAARPLCRAQGALNMHSYLPYVDGLRALAVLAVLAVLAYHLDPS